VVAASAASLWEEEVVTFAQSEEEVLVLVVPISAKVVPVPEGALHILALVDTSA